MILAEIKRLRLSGKLPTREDELAYARRRVAALARRRAKSRGRGGTLAGDRC
jgi:hypothetical protein